MNVGEADVRVLSTYDDPRMASEHSGIGPHFLTTGVMSSASGSTMFTPSGLFQNETGVVRTVHMFTMDRYLACKGRCGGAMFPPFLDERGICMFRKLLGAAVVGAAMMAAMPARAATYIITYTGHVSSGYDSTGVFGSINADLTGVAYKSVYTLTYQLPGAYYYDDGVVGSAFGGQVYGAPTPVSADLTINGVTKTVSGNYLGAASQHNKFPPLPSGSLPNGYDEISHDAEDNQLIGNNYLISFVRNNIYSTSNNIISTSNITSSLNYSVQNGDISDGFFRYNLYDYRSGTQIEYAQGSLVADNVTIIPFSSPSGGDESSGAVPEPATWAMMIVGLGAVGATMRGNARRKVRVGLA